MTKQSLRASNLEFSNDAEAAALPVLCDAGDHCVLLMIISSPSLTAACTGKPTCNCFASPAMHLRQPET